MIGSWQAHEAGDDQRTKLPLQLFVEGHLAQLKELSIGLSRTRSYGATENHLPQFFDTVPSVSLPLTVLKLGVIFELFPQFFDWVKPIFPQLVTLWISKPIFDEQNLKRLLSLLLENGDAASGLRLRHLLLHTTEPTENMLLDLSRAFPRLQTLRFLFHSVVQNLPMGPDDHGHYVRLKFPTRSQRRSHGPLLTVLFSFRRSRSASYTRI